MSHQDASMKTPEHRKLKTPRNNGLPDALRLDRQALAVRLGQGQRESSLPISRNHPSVVANPSSRLIGL